MWTYGRRHIKIDGSGAVRAFAAMPCVTGYGGDSGRFASGPAGHVFSRFPWPDCMKGHTLAVRRYGYAVAFALVCGTA